MREYRTTKEMLAHIRGRIEPLAVKVAENTNDKNKRYFMLSKAITERQGFNVYINENGYKKTREIKLMPNTVYEVTKTATKDNAITDFVLEQLLVIETKKRIPYSAEKESLLKENGIKYEVKACQACGGKKKYLNFHYVVEVKP